jgi:hypothetical protein
MSWQFAAENRRDGLPHRADFLSALARFSILMGLIAVSCGAVGVADCSLGVSASLCGLTGLLGLPLGIAVSVMARKDIGLIFIGEIEQSGRVRTEEAKAEGQAGVTLNAIGFLFWSIVAVFAICTT